jgi:cobaltochelatase CobN
MQGMLLRPHGQGKAGLPEARLKDIWKRERLLRTIQLTVSECLGPCDVPNVVQVITPEGTEWYGELDKEAHYQALIDWARACHATKSLMARPETLAPHRFCGLIQVQGPQQKGAGSAEESTPLSCSALPVEPPT